MDIDNLSGKEKAMVFLAALGDDASAKVLKCLPDKLGEKISEELNFFPKPSKEMMAHVFKELNKLTLKPSPEEDAKITQEIESRLDKEGEKARKAVKPAGSSNILERLEPGELLNRLQNEQVQTIAFILSLLSATARDNFLQLLSPGRRKEISELKVEDTNIKEKVREQVEQVLATA